MARGLVRGEGYHVDQRNGTVFRGDLRAYRIPGYSFFLACVFRVFGENYAWVRFLQCVAGSFTVLLVWGIGDFCSRRVAWIAGIAAAVYPDLVTHSSAVLAESIHTFLFVAAIFLMLRAERPRGDFAAGLVWGAATMCKTNSLTLLPFVWVWSLLRRHWPVAILRAGLVTLGFALVIGSWIARNAVVVGAPILNSDSGRVLWEANNAFNTKGTGGDVTMPFHRYHHLSEVEQSRAFAREGTQYLRSLPPGRLVLFLAKKVGSFLYPFHARYDVAFGLVFPLWRLGMWRAVRTRDAGGLLLLGVALSFIAGSMIGPGNPRFREIFAPFMLVQAAVGAVGALDAARARRNVLLYLAWAALQFGFFALDDPIRRVIKEIVL